jgi:hypothetical protein
MSGRQLYSDDYFGLHWRAAANYRVYLRRQTARDFPPTALIARARIPPDPQRISLSWTTEIKQDAELF